MRKKVNRSAGFTLMEMLVVVAIVAVLIAVAIPVFGSSMAKARKSICSSYCDTLESVLISAYTLGNMSEEDISSLSLSEENGYTFRGIDYECPSGGTLYAELVEDSVSVRCRYHDDGETGGRPPSSLTNESAEQVWGVVSVMPGNVDSTAVSGARRNALLAKLTENGLDLDALGIVSWKYVQSANSAYFQWTTADIATLEPETPITVMRYWFEGEFKGIYSVWKGKAQRNANGINTVYTYSDSRTSEYTYRLPAEDKKDIDNVISYYNDNSLGFPRIP